MIERYKSPIMNKIWSEEEKIKRWTNIEILACSVYHERGEISNKEFNIIKKIKSPKIKRISEIEQKINHDVAAFVQALSEKLKGNISRHIHRGLTSSDVIDTAQAIAIVESLECIKKDLKIQNFILHQMAIKYKNTPCIGRTHGVHAEVITFGLRVLGWYSELKRNLDRINNAIENLRYGKLSGAVGTYSQNDIEFERDVLKELGLKCEPVSTQIIPRDRYAELFSTLTLICSLYERIATEIRSLQRTEIQEVQENFSENQIGSSAMPHKRNPIASEKLCGIARLLRGYLLTSYENINLWHDRDISHSSVERVILPDSFHLVHYSVLLMNGLLRGLKVYPDKMMENVNKTNGLIFSQNVLGLLLSVGMKRKDAYDVIQKSCKEVLEKKVDFIKSVKNNLPKNIKIADRMLEEKTNIDFYLRHVDKIFERI
jgi:adenylosuccinate lyase